MLLVKIRTRFRCFFFFNLQVEWSDVELSGATVRLKVLPEHLPEHRQHLKGAG